MGACVIKQGALYWRPNGCGYTGSLLEAGIYPDVKALQIEGGRREPLDKAIPITPEMVAALEAEVQKTLENIERFRQALPCPSCRRERHGEFHVCAASEAPYSGLDDGPSLAAVQCGRLREGQR